MARIFSHSIANYLAISCILGLVLFDNYGRRTNGCDDDGVWSKTDFSFSPCDNKNLDELYECGYKCRVKKLGVGACFDDTCLCCAMEDPNGSFLSRGYLLPCMYSYVEDHENCDQSCYQQGAKFGGCNDEGWCQCNGNPAGRRRIGCDDRDLHWSKPKLAFSPCDNSNLEHLYDCGSDCRQQNLGVGACLDNTCSCCAMEDPTGASFKSRGYSVPCKENVDEHKVECKDSCYKQGANDGDCFEGSCHCTDIPTGTRTTGCEDDDDDWSESELSFSPCDNSELEQLYNCGFTCRQQKLGVGACFNNNCMCCAMKNPTASFQSRGYSMPCIENYDNHELKCDDSCYQQGANNGECIEGSCRCTGVPAK